jgi:chromate transporter
MASYIALFWSFFKVGLFTFGGGYAMIPIIEHEIIDRRQWLARKEFLDLLTLAQSSPGPIAINTSVFVGYKMRGVRGAITAILGTVLPSFTIMLIIALFFSTIRDNVLVDAAFKGLRPAVVALIFVPTVALAREMHPALTIVTIATAMAIWGAGISPMWLLLLGALLGIVWVIHKGKEVES